MLSLHVVQACVIWSMSLCKLITSWRFWGEQKAGSTEFVQPTELHWAKDMAVRLSGCSSVGIFVNGMGSFEK
jgi:hypothetical protein